MFAISEQHTHFNNCRQAVSHRPHVFSKNNEPETVSVENIAGSRGGAGGGAVGPDPSTPSLGLGAHGIVQIR